MFAGTPRRPAAPGIPALASASLRSEYATIIPRWLAVHHRSTRAAAPCLRAGALGSATRGLAYRRPWRSRESPSRTFTLHRAPVGQGPPGPGWLAISLGFWSGRALATGTAWVGLCLIHHHHRRPELHRRRRRGLQSRGSGVSRLVVVVCRRALSRGGYVVSQESSVPPIDRIRPRGILRPPRERGSCAKLARGR